MARSRQCAAPRDIVALFRVGVTGGLTDEQLLERFVGPDREAADIAFAELVARHGPMVLRVCRATLRDPHDAEDAFQATFLVLASRTGSIRKRGSAASWLHGVARRVAMRARSTAARRRVYERRAAELSRRSPNHEGWDDLGDVLHEEVQRLPERYRTAVVLCDLEGLTEGQAAQQLGWPIGTIRTRLSRGRERLRSRLVRRGVAPSFVWSSPAAMDQAARGPLPAGLIDCTVRGAVQLGAAGTVPAAVSSLTGGVLRAMFLTKLKVYATALLAVGAASVLAIGTVGFTQQPPQTKPPSPKPEAPRLEPPETAATLARLDQPVPMVFPNKIPLKEVLKHIKQATKRGPLDPGLAIYVDPIGLQEAECSLNSTVTLNVENTPLRDTLPQVLGQLGLSHLVKDGVLIISSLQAIDTEWKEPLVLAKDDSPRTAAVLDQLAGPIPMSFPNEIPIEQVLAYIRQATTTRTSAGVPVLVDALALQEAERSLNSTVSIDVDGVPLRITLELVLRQLGLAYVVRDGLVIVSSPGGLQRLEGSTRGAASSKESPKK